ncbi:MAG: glycosyltransferase [Phycisphaerae bacterium]|nr:glycosyltransferase [Phycisphaerae bacterium]
MRVALLVTDLERGGTPLRLVRLARGLSAAGVEVHAGCLAPRGPLSSELTAAGLATFACDAEDARDFLALKRLSQHMRRVQPDLIHATLLHANVAARIVGGVQHIPVVGATATIEVERPWHRALERATAGLDRAHIVNSHAVAEHVIRVFGVPRRRVHIVPPSLDPWPRRVERAAARAALGIPAHEFVVAWVGRLDPVKRLGLIVSCAEIMTTVPVRFLLAGEGPERANLERSLRLSSAARVVHLLGWQADIGAVLSAADAFLCPSRTEGMPNAVLEALACGVPVVASDIPALRELAGAHGHIVLVRGSAAQDYVAALLKLRADEPARRALGQSAADWARAHLDPQATVQAVLKVYQGVLRHTPAR